jgi:hypothetical protein
MCGIVVRENGQVGVNGGRAWRLEAVGLFPRRTSSRLAV